MTITMEMFQNINTILLTIFLLIWIVAMITMIMASYKASQTITNIKKMTDIPMFAVNALIERLTWGK